LLEFLLDIIIYSWSSILALNKIIFKVVRKIFLRVKLFRDYILFENTNFEIPGVQLVASSTLLDSYGSAQKPVYSATNIDIS
jgi:hypothetical protein